MVALLIRRTLLKKIEYFWRMKLKEGDVFSILLTEDLFGFGQIVKIPNKNNFIIAVFDYTSNTVDIDLKKIIDSKLIFLGYTLDAKLYHKHWVIIGNTSSNLSEVKLPYFKLGTPPGDVYITNYKGEIVRDANKQEFEELIYQTVVAPVRFENALKAYFKLQEWKDEDYNKLLYSHVLNSNDIAIGNKLKG